MRLARSVVSRDEAVPLQPTTARSLVQELPGSKIREVADAGIGRDDVLAFWFGESDEVTPQPIRDAAAASIAAGETFYSSNLGLPSLRAAIASYMAGLHGPMDESRIAVTSGGVNALMIALQALLDAGDEVVAVVPLWPNLTAQARILGAHVKRISLHFDRQRPRAAGNSTSTACWQPSRRRHACCC